MVLCIFIQRSPSLGENTRAGSLNNQIIKTNYFIYSKYICTAKKKMMINCTNTSKPPSSETTDGVTMMELFMVKIHEYLVRIG